MTFEEIANKADDLHLEIQTIPDANIHNYRSVIGNYKQVLSDMDILIRNLARNLQPADEPRLPNAGSFS